MCEYHFYSNTSIETECVFGDKVDESLAILV